MRALPISSRSMGKQCEVSVERDLHGVIEQGSLAFLACACRPASRAHPRHNRRPRCRHTPNRAELARWCRGWEAGHRPSVTLPKQTKSCFVSETTVAMSFNGSGSAAHGLAGSAPTSDDEDQQTCTLHQFSLPISSQRCGGVRREVQATNARRRSSPIYDKLATLDCLRNFS
jgi:hypothetical protein